MLESIIDAGNLRDDIADAQQHILWHWGRWRCGAVELAGHAPDVASLDLLLAALAWGSPGNSEMSGFQCLEWSARDLQDTSSKNQAAAAAAEAGHRNSQALPMDQKSSIFAWLANSRVNVQWPGTRG